jgi:hypothetical protein
MKLRFVLAATALAAMALATPAFAKGKGSGVKVGTLTCNVESGWGFVFGSSRDVHCIYRPNEGAAARYSGEINKYGVDIGYTEGGVMIWVVVAPTSDVGPDALEGNYGGVSAGASIGVGGDANVLVGGLDKSIALQPLSLEGHRGLNIAAGVAGLELKYVKP